VIAKIKPIHFGDPEPEALESLPQKRGGKKLRLPMFTMMGSLKNKNCVYQHYPEV
jgi:hypothetical protein